MNSDQIEQKLTKQGHRPTASRHEVIEALLTSPGHLTADHLYEQMRESGSRIGRMTVFRTLDLLAEIGIVRPTYQGSGAAHFVLLNDGHHHHLVCMQCSKTVEFLDCSLADDLSQQLAQRFKFKIEGHLLEIYGVCETCQE
ncbi:MAG: Fur family ferric uptake transcriptional regulator [Cellvibrionaceae bacterium]|jgi:Fur family ferric uptake transcriptional regulator